jgi:hypothetical protein
MHVIAVLFFVMEVSWIICCLCDRLFGARGNFYKEVIIFNFAKASETLNIIVPVFL